MGPTEPKPTIPLSPQVQQRNLILFATCTGLQYLAAPVLYVGITQASLCEKLGASAKVSNLPGTFFFAMTVMPAIVAWLFPRIAHLKPLLSFCYAANAVVMGLIAIALSSQLPPKVMILLIVLQGAICGATIPTAIALLWEMVGRGAEESKRGLALGLAFGAGPMLAVFGSVGQTALLGGTVFWTMEGLGFPQGYTYLFGIGAPCIGLAAILVWFFEIPVTEKEPERKPISHVADLLGGLALAVVALALFVFGSDLANASADTQANENVAAKAKPGAEDSKSKDAAKSAEQGLAVGIQVSGYLLLALATGLVARHFRDVLSSRTLLLATIVTVLVYTGNTIPSNMNLYSEEALGGSPQEYAGAQNALRFGFKMVAGALLGWMLTRSHPKAGLLMTAGIFVFAQFWSIATVGQIYLVAFGIYGAGELVGVYAPNYMLSATPKPKIRRTMALATMLMVPAAPAGFLFGTIVDQFKGTMGTAAAFRLSFGTCAAIMIVGILIAVFALPKRPGVGESAD